MSTLVAGCGGEDEAPPTAATLELSGPYRPVDQGAIGAITFTGNKDYLLLPDGCAGGACAELGTYRIDSAKRVLVLEDGATHETRTWALEILETKRVERTLVKSLQPLDLVNPGEQLTRPGGETTKGQQDTVNEQQQLMQGQSQLSGVISQLLRFRVEGGQTLIQNQK